MDAGGSSGIDLCGPERIGIMPCAVEIAHPPSD
jgi:hypothetical protein